MSKEELTRMLPDAPAGHFWRITEMPLFGQPLVQLRKSTRLWSVLVDEISTPDYAVTVEAYAEAARDILEGLERQAAFRKGKESLSGDYGRMV